MGLEVGELVGAIVALVGPVGVLVVSVGSVGVSVGSVGSVGVSVALVGSVCPEVGGVKVGGRVVLPQHRAVKGAYTISSPPPQMSPATFR